MKRLPHLDAVRGIAALVVMIHHAWLSLPLTATRWYGLPTPFSNPVVLGRPAVVLFFVLSGYVLTLCLQAAPLKPARFALRRLLRILPPYWVAIVIAYGLFRVTPHRTLPTMSPWLGEQWGASAVPASLGRHLLLLAGPRQFPLDHVAWSLVHEIRLSLLMPFFLLLSRRCGVVACVVLAAAVSLAADAVVVANPKLFPAGYHGFLFDAAGLSLSLTLSARYTFAFVIGLAAATQARRISLLQERPHQRLAVVAGASILLSQPSEVAMTIGAALLVSALASSQNMERTLSAPVCAWLGRTSYSLYLLHLPIMLACAAWLDGALPPLVTLGIAMAASLVAADLMHRLVERPSIVLSRLAGADVTGRLLARLEGLRGTGHGQADLPLCGARRL